MTDLLSLRQRALQTLGDAEGALHSPELLDECLRQALQQVCSAGDAGWTVEGLDGALTTSLPAQHEYALMLGAAGLACAIRSLLRVERFDLNQQVPALIEQRAERFLSEFRLALEGVRRRTLQLSEQAPYGQPWALDDGDTAWVSAP